ncbi:MAG: tRNA uridine-5-carboxymethylaminomethyl(34) synthesis GTPase MnmE [Bacteroidales bacterium]|jgi:tRNA modification GTPase|nr:tRNA uridine-5-carboxymethylaminomethyl(34) synthesis GTPase MnmE [Bacteroidales bacterium]
MNNYTIVAPATVKGHSAIGIIRLSGKNAIEIADKTFHSNKGNLGNKEPNTANFGTFVFENKIIDECIFTIFHAPASYTGENMVEISHHGSPFIQQSILLSLIALGAKTAEEGEFTKRAFLNGKLNLSQAEAVADIIAAENKLSHDFAMQQLRGGYNDTLKNLRTELVSLCSLLELELDFSEEDLTFANRKQIKEALLLVKQQISDLLHTFSLGNAFKKGVPVAIVGRPNSGKSTLLNTILNEQRSIVSDIAGTTRDTVEEVMTIDGYDFRFIDTAGIRQTTDNKIEEEGIKRTFQAINNAKIILYLFDLANSKSNELSEDMDTINENADCKGKKFILIGNKADLAQYNLYNFKFDNPIMVSALEKKNIDKIIAALLKEVEKEDLENKTILTNARHYEIMNRALTSVLSAEEAFEKELPTDLIATDIRTVLHYIGEITGEITNEEILNNIFSKFCIGK